MQAGEAAFALGVKDLLLYWLTGNIATEPSSGPYADRWPDDVFSFIGWTSSRLPPVLPSTAIGGQLLSSRASERFSADLPVVMGLNDGSSATLGAGCRRAGDGVISLGTNGVLRIITNDQPREQDCLSRSLFRYPFVDDHWVVGGFELSGGDSLRWLVRALSGTESEEAYVRVLNETATVPAGSEGALFLPYLVVGVAQHRTLRRAQPLFLAPTETTAGVTWCGPFLRACLSVSRTSRPHWRSSAGRWNGSPSRVVDRVTLANDYRRRL